MGTLNRDDKLNLVKKKLEKLINGGFLKEANKILSHFESKIELDSDIISMKATLLVLQGRYDEARILLSKEILKFPLDQDILFNLAYVYGLEDKSEEALNIYNDLILIGDEKIQEDVINAINKIKEDKGIRNSVKKKIAFFVKKGMDSFLGNIIDEMSRDYHVKKIIVSCSIDIELGMKWSDICWFEWCDELIITGSKLPIAREKKIICRLHSYEAFTHYIHDVNWIVVDQLVLVAEHIKNLVLQQVKELNENNTIVIPNGINLKDYKLVNREKGFNIAFVGYINFKKGPMLLLHAFHSIYQKDKRYKLFIAGKYQELRYALYFQQIIHELGLQDNVFFEGWQTDIANWLKDKHYIISTSVLEGHPVGIMEAMARGMKPLIHNFVGARGIFPPEYIWNTFDECYKMLSVDEYNPIKYRNFIKNKYSLDKQEEMVHTVIRELLNMQSIRS
ncbi:glycosyltransferase [Bacillus sp. NEB1478]|uniref:glycosyltransferase n=1 Tax=Bacillus sp. NEB1478 TaxID=3073816 RepID=UPI0028731437|nr:glycosyltransferase [Bacillus sp. NEB1478]WNB92723.1 glycosyltransferase [Bacillus sp. NEB1478]